jgi:hypothetical protein
VESGKYSLQGDMSAAILAFPCLRFNSNQLFSPAHPNGHFSRHHALRDFLLKPSKFERLLLEEPNDGDSQLTDILAIYFPDPAQNSYEFGGCVLTLVNYNSTPPLF